MDKQNQELERLLQSLTERAKELNCLFNIEELLRDYDKEIADILFGITEAVPPGWQYPDLCHCRIIYHGITFCPPDFIETPWNMSAEIKVQDLVVGTITVTYSMEVPSPSSEPFLPDEARLLATIADRIGGYIQHQNMSHILSDLERVKEARRDQQPAEWKFAVDLLERTDQSFYFRIARKMLNLLCSSGIKEANDLIRKLSAERSGSSPEEFEDENQPRIKEPQVDLEVLSRETFKLADRHMRNSEILAHVQDWMQEDRASFLLKALATADTSLVDIVSAVRKFVQMSPETIELPDFATKGMRVALIRRAISDDLNYIRIAKEYVDLYDFHQLLNTLIYPSNSRGRIGGKSAGLFLAASILKSASEKKPELKGIRTPKTWYVTSDGQLSFVQYNNLEEVIEQKYKDISHVRQEYHHIIQLFKNSQFPPELVHGISTALDDFGDKPLIVRSSSLLEDRFGAAFSGKYKSLFVANQGSKSERLNALLDAIAEVYSSTFGPDPIEYRSERGLLDFHEEMSIMIQEVVGSRVGKYYLPSYAGVAFSNNEFRWSPRISRDDGLVRMVPGLGTRAVDRLSDDYPVLLAPGQPGLRVNQSLDEIIRYSPEKIDVIDLAENRFESLTLREFLMECGDQIPSINQMISIIRDNHIQKPSILGTDFGEETAVVTFRGLIDETPFVDRMHSILETLQDAMKTPVDIEFASDGQDFYLLQCRPQSAAPGSAPATIPRDLPDSTYLFSANRYISNGHVPEITHIVYVDPEAYGELEDLKTLHDVGHAIGELNKLLPKRQFILMGPGRWGSRGDIKLGVNITYSEINNTSVLIEIARQTGRYVPDLSFGTHFFQDLVEASIRYLPLYPDLPDIKFNEKFLLESSNILSKILPKYSHLDRVIRVIDVPKVTGGKVLAIYMNAELNEAVGIFSQPTGQLEVKTETQQKYSTEASNEHWQWRFAMVERIARCIDPQETGVAAMYVIGSTKNGTAGPGSDIDLLLHFTGDEKQKESLLQWLKGWSLSLDEMNFMRTGYRSEGLLDIHFITDEDIEKQTSYAVKIGAITDSALEIPLNSGPKEKVK